MIDYTLPLDQLPDPLPIEPLTRPFDVTITPPGSKSITCRAYVLAALAKGESKIIRPLRADDTDLLLKALCTLGAEARWAPHGEDVYIKGVNGRFPRGGSVNLGDGGTPTRFMIACACLAAEPVVVDGSKRMRERPIAEGVDLLRRLGAKIEYVEAEGRLPVRVTPSESLLGGEINVGRPQSSQFVSALLLIGSSLRHGVEVRMSHSVTSASYIHMTLGMIEAWLDDSLERTTSTDTQRRLCIPSTTMPAHEFEIEPDASSAVYWMLAAAINPRSKAYVPQMSASTRSRQPDAAIVPIFQDVGCDTDFSANAVGVCGPPRLMWAVDCDAATYPDASLGLSVLAAKCETSSRITGLRTLRVKETDRIDALANELRKVGCIIETGEDWIEITPPHVHAGADERRRSEEAPDRALSRGQSGASSLRSSAPAWAAREDPIIIETYNDHRMAMAFGVLGLAAPRITDGRPLAIRNPKCVAKSYPTFWKDFAKLYQ
jgi:3-phosphoshikimate 1-carboxyvinyltransferase